MATQQWKPDQVTARSTIAAVVLNYNYARFLSQALDSLLAQDDPLDQIIVVDDGSTDQSLEVLSSYSTVVTIVAKENGGQLSAAIAGLEVVETAYVYFLDADDLAQPSFTGTVRGELSSQPVKIQFPLMAVDTHLKPTGSIFPGLSDSYDSAAMRHDVEVLGWYLCPPTSGNVFQTAALRGLPLSSLNQRDFIDGPVVLAFPFLGEIRSIGSAQALYRIHGENHSQWHDVSVSHLEAEITWFTTRWDEAFKELAVQRQRPLNKTGYVVERRLMISALSGKPKRGLAWEFVLLTWQAHFSVLERCILTLWALSVSLPFRSLRAKAILSRRSPTARGRFTGFLTILLRRIRRAE